MAENTNNIQPGFATRNILAEKVAQRAREREERMEKHNNLHGQSTIYYSAEEVHNNFKKQLNALKSKIQDKKKKAKRYMDDQLLAIQRVYSKQVQDAKIKLDRAKNSERQNIKQFVEVNKAEVRALDKTFAQDKHKLEVEHGLINIDPDIEDRASRRGTNLAFNVPNNKNPVC